MTDPFISVIIPTHNRLASVYKAIESVLSQSYSRFELIVVDDASTDSSYQSLAQRFGDQLILCTQQHLGVSSARNLGVRKSRGDWIAFLDSDDIWHKGKLEYQMSFHQKNPQLKISQTQEIWIRQGKRVSARKKHQKPSGYIFPQSLELCLVSPSSVILARDLFDQSGGFDEDLPVCEDYDLWLRISSQNDVGLLDELLLTKYGGHEDQLSHRYKAMDRFRIYSLVKILLSGQLTEVQRNQVMIATKQKAKILKLGSQKRRSDFIQIERLLNDAFISKISLDDFIGEGKALLLNDELFDSD